MRQRQIRRRKLHSQSGETLVEVLASILIGSLSIGLLATLILTSARINDTARQHDDVYYVDLAAAEAQTETATDGTGTALTGDVTVQETSPGAAGGPVTYEDVPLYGGDGVYSYRKRSGSPGADPASLSMAEPFPQPGSDPYEMAAALPGPRTVDLEGSSTDGGDAS